MPKLQFAGVVVFGFDAKFLSRFLRRAAAWTSVFMFAPDPLNEPEQNVLFILQP